MKTEKEVLDSFLRFYDADLEYVSNVNGESPTAQLLEAIDKLRYLLSLGAPCIYTSRRIIEISLSLDQWIKQLSTQREMLLSLGLTDEKGFATVRHRLERQSKTEKENDDGHNDKQQD